MPPVKTPKDRSIVLATLDTLEMESVALVTITNLNENNAEFFFPSIMNFFSGSPQRPEGPQSGALSVSCEQRELENHSFEFSLSLWQAAWLAGACALHTELFKLAAGIYFMVTQHGRQQ